MFSSSSYTIVLTPFSISLFKYKCVFWVPFNPNTLSSFPELPNPQSVIEYLELLIAKKVSHFIIESGYIFTDSILVLFPCFIMVPSIISQNLSIFILNLFSNIYCHQYLSLLIKYINIILKKCLSYKTCFQL